MRAFLSHSSADKEYVQTCARELGRQYVLFDEYVLDAGDPIQTTIDRCIAASGLFVFFASKDSVESAWVQHESRVAALQSASRRLETLCIALSPDVGPGSLPTWLMGSSLGESHSPKSAARLIKAKLDQVIRERQRSHFLGRSREVAELESLLRPVGKAPPKHFCVYGLPGVGRRTLARRVARDMLSLRLDFEIGLEEFESLRSVAAKLAEKVGLYNTETGLRALLSEISRESPEELAQRVSRYLHRANSQGEITIFIDDGGMLDDSGALANYVTQAVGDPYLPTSPYVALASTRRPRRGGPPDLRLRALDQVATRQLVSLLLEDMGVRHSEEELGEMASFVGGYPPAAWYVVRQAKEYGLSAVLADKRALAQFKADAFLTHLERQALSDEHKLVLRLLGIYSPLPLRAIGPACGLLEDATAAALKLLQDYSLVEQEGATLYKIAPPIVQAVERMLGLLPNHIHHSVAMALQDVLRNDDEVDHRLTLERAYFRAASRARLDTTNSIYLPTDVANLAETSYHARQYIQCLEYCEQALALAEAAEEPSQASKIRQLRVKSLIQLERWKAAKEGLDQLGSVLRTRDHAFLKGFFHRRRREHRSALAAYLEARQSGYNGIAISRELALCHMLLGNAEAARNELNAALKRDRTNPFLVDMWAQLAISLRDWSDAEEALDVLEKVDRPYRYAHRRASLHLAKGEVADAHRWSKAALEHPESTNSFEVVASGAWAALLAGAGAEADQLLGTLNKRFGTQKPDVRKGLRAFRLCQRRKYREAYTVAQSMTDLSRGYRARFLGDAIKGLLSGSDLVDDERIRLKRELQELGDPEDAVDVAVRSLLQPGPSE